MERKSVRVDKNVQANLARAVLVPDFKDSDGMDEWVCTVKAFFDGSRSEKFHGTFRQCVDQAGKFMAKDQTKQYRVTIERVM